MAEPCSTSLVDLPPELIDHIFGFLSPYDLVSLSTTCQKLCDHSQNDRFWQAFIQSNVSTEVTSKGPCVSFKELYIQHHPRWFLTRHKIWYSDYNYSGTLLVTRFDQRRGCIEAYAAAAQRCNYSLGLLNWDGQIGFRTFNPQVQLDLNKPIIHLPVNLDPERSRRFQNQTIMTDSNISRVASSFNLTRFLSASAASWVKSAWPPLNLPSPGNKRTRNDSSTSFQGTGHKPAKLSEVSDATFRIRQWIEFQHFLPITGGTSTTSEVTHTYATLPEECYIPTKEKPWQGIWCGDYSAHGCEFLVIMQVDSSYPLSDKARKAFAMWPHTDVDMYGLGGRGANDDDEDEDDEEDDIDEEDDLYMGGVAPTNAAAARHFLRHQRPSNDPDPSPDDVAPHKGRLIGIKLTGDPNIPRGEITFIAEDLGAKGHVGFAPEPLFSEEHNSIQPWEMSNTNETIRSAASDPSTTANPDLPPTTSIDDIPTVSYQQDSRGARIVKAVGHVANGGFRGDEYIPTQLVMVSENTLAQYWRPLGHVSFYKRVDINALLKLDIVPEDKSREEGMSASTRGPSRGNISVEEGE